MSASASWLLEQEARALFVRLARIKPFVLQETMVVAAAITPAAQTAIERFLVQGRRELRNLIRAFLVWVKSPDQEIAPDEAQRRFTALRMRFNDVLSQFDLFSDVITQRSESETGVWLAGLDVAAAEALTLPGDYYQPPLLICYLDRGPGAAIRRARTRLPGGGENPVAIIRVPRERMIGSGIASSLVHEVGHQGAALLDLIPSLKPILQQMHQRGGEDATAWQFWDRWISEILADFWAIAKLGITSTLGLMAVVSLPRYFVFRINPDDPHPMPWLRVKLSCAIGDNLYPHPQWSNLARLWESFYPRAGLDEERLKILDSLEQTMPEFVSLLAGHRPASLGGASLKEVLCSEERKPARLADYHRAWRGSPGRMLRAPLSLIFAVMGQARMDGQITPEEESRTLAYMLTYRAMRSTLDISATCGARPVAPLGQPGVAQ
jgi:hypothetical protein